MPNKIKIFSGRATQYLAEKIARSYGTELGTVVVTDFCDEEFQPSFEENIRGNDIFIVQSTFAPASNMMDLRFPWLSGADGLRHSALSASAGARGPDQTAHVELTREVARRFNALYKTSIFPEPEALFTPTPKFPAPTAARCQKATGIRLG